jgi:hypothetical protein
VAIGIVLFVVLAVVFKIRYPMRPLSQAHMAHVPPELPYKHWRERQKKRVAGE